MQAPTLGMQLAYAIISLLSSAEAGEKDDGSAELGGGESHRFYSGTQRD